MHASSHSNRKDRKRLGLEMDDMDETLHVLTARADTDQTLVVKVTEVKQRINQMDNEEWGVRTLLAKLLGEKDLYLNSISGKKADEVVL